MKKFVLLAVILCLPYCFGQTLNNGNCYSPVNITNTDWVYPIPISNRTSFPESFSTPRGIGAKYVNQIIFVSFEGQLQWIWQTNSEDQEILRTESNKAGKMT
jgi:hypothetical protein